MENKTKDVATKVVPGRYMTENDYEVVILEVFEGMAFGRYFDEHNGDWVGCNWTDEGRYFIYDDTTESAFDLIMNEEK